MIKVEITGAYANIDWIRFDTTEEGLPIRNPLKLDVAESQDFYVFSAKGRMLTKVNAADLNQVREELQVRGMQPGAYIIRSADGNVKQLIKITK